MEALGESAGIVPFSIQIYQSPPEPLVSQCKWGCWFFLASLHSLRADQSPFLLGWYVVGCLWKGRDNKAFKIAEDLNPNQHRRVIRFCNYLSVCSNSRLHSEPLIPPDNGLHIWDTVSPSALSGLFGWQGRRWKGEEAKDLKQLRLWDARSAARDEW